MTQERAVKQSMANRLLDLQRGSAPFPEPGLTLRIAALTGTAHPSPVPAGLGWFQCIPSLSWSPPPPSSIRRASSFHSIPPSVAAT